MDPWASLKDRIYVELSEVQNVTMENNRSTEIKAAETLLRIRINFDSFQLVFWGYAGFQT